MLGFLSKKKSDHAKVTNKEIYFVHCDNNLSKDDLKISLTKTAFDFAEKLNLKKVYLHFGKELIEYDF